MTIAAKHVEILGRLGLGSTTSLEITEDIRQLEADFAEALALLRIQDVESDWGAARRAFLARIDARNGNGHGCELVNCSGVGPHASHSRRAK